MITKDKPLVIEFPMRGEWLTPTTPAKQIPSHGTNRMGLRYAYDFLQVDWGNKNKPFHNVNALRYLLFGVPLKRCYCWGQNIYAPGDGEIVSVIDDVFERPIVHWLVDSTIAIKNAIFFNENKDDYSKIAGNYIIMKYDTGVYLVFAHLQKNSIRVKLNEKIKKGTILGKIGHSGNSTSPHLHFQVMDHYNPAKAKGIPCVFEQYELYQDGNWKTVYKQMPSDKDRIRFLGI
ncbi:MAG: M23 family metallopeptidase [Coprobacillaceae bacterium]